MALARWVKTAFAASQARPVKLHHDVSCANRVHCCCIALALEGEDGVLKLHDMLGIWYTVKFWCLAPGCDLEGLGGSLSVWGSGAVCAVG